MNMEPIIMLLASSLEAPQIAMIVVGNSLVGLAICYFGIKQKMAQYKAKKDAELEEKRINASLEIERERIKSQAEQAKVAYEANKPKTCSYCGSQNPADAKFCEGCGSRMLL